MRRTSIVALAAVTLACGPRVVVEGSGDSEGEGDQGSTTATEPTPPVPDPSGPAVTTASPSTTAAPSTTEGPGTSGTSTGGLESSSTGDRADWVEEARERYPTFRALVDGYLERSCTPFQSVCHADRDYPELTSVLDYVAAFGGHCERTDEPGCEQLRLGDVQGSYLFNRMVEPAYGSLMPLATEPAPLPEVGALACWIEQTLVADPEAVDALIRYETCVYAAG